MKHSVIALEQIRSSAFRSDAEYWHPEFISNASLVSPETRVRDQVEPTVSNIKSSPIGASFDYLEISRISTSACEYRTVPIEEGEEPDRAHYLLKSGDIAVSTVRPNRNAVAFIEEDGIVGSSGLCVLRTRNLEPEYLFAFCKTDYFVKSLVRASKASMYPAVSNGDILDTPLFLPGEAFGRAIAEIVSESLSRMHQARLVYEETHEFLLSELRLGCWQPDASLSFVKKFSDIQDAQRIDADYFRPKYDSITTVIREYPGGCEELGNLASISKCVEVGSAEYQEEGIPFVRVSNLSPLDISEEKYISQDLYDQLQEYQPNRGEILLTKDATPGIAHLLRYEPGMMIPSGGILRLKPNSQRIDGEFLALILNSLAVREQVNRDVGGSVIVHWRPEQVEKILVPVLPWDKQWHIRDRMAYCSDLRRQSGALLMQARDAIQMAIERDERTAIDWIATGDRKRRNDA